LENKPLGGVFYLYISKLRDQIECERNKMHQLVDIYGLADVRVLAQSVLLDDCLNNYNRFLQIYSADEGLSDVSFDFHSSIQ
jgi:hypothetical protein